MESGKKEQKGQQADKGKEEKMAKLSSALVKNIQRRKAAKKNDQQ